MLWLCLGLVAAVYAGYPAALWLVTRVVRVRPRADDAFTPPVTLVISAYNEEAVIGARLDNALKLDYPALEIAVADDGSTDRTHEIAAGYASWGVKLHTCPRGGKNAALNAVVPALATPILVFSDANSMYEPGAIRKLVRHFADERVGVVAGELRYEGAGDSAAAGGEGAYWGLERCLKRWESLLGRTLVANGSILALRRELAGPLRPDVANDFQWPTEARAKGYWLLYESEAVASERSARTLREEFARKSRIVGRGMRGFLVLAGLFSPGHMLQFLLRKGLRWFGGLFALLLLAASATAPGEVWIRALFWGQVAFYALAVAGFLLDRRGRRTPLTTLPLYFCVVQAAALTGVWRALRGRSPAKWESAPSTRG